MKVLSTHKPEIPAQTTPDTDSFASKNISAPSDLLYALFMQASSELMTQTGDADKIAVPDLKKEDIQNQLSSDINTTTDNNPLFAQLNLLNMTNNENNKEVTNDEKPTILSDLKQKSDVPKVSQPEPQTQQTKQIQQTQPLKEPQQLQNTQPLQEAQQLQQSKDPMLNEIDSDPKALAEIANTLQLDTQPNDKLNNKIEKKPDVKPDVNRDWQSINNDIKNDIKGIFSAADKTQDPSLKPVNLLEAIKEPLNHSSNQQPQNKYTEALTQLGSFINTQTTNNLSNNGHSLSLDSINMQNNYAEALKKTQQTQYDINIELIKPSMDALNQESYDAKIKIYPPELGTVLAKLRVNKNSTELTILTENSQVKAIVEANLSQLRDKFQQADINLTNIQVQTSQTATTSDQNNDNKRNNESFLSDRGNELNNQALPTKSSTRASNALIDTYA